MSLLIASIAGDLGNISVLALLLILIRFFLCGSRISPESSDTIFLPVTILLSLVQLLFLVFLGFFGGLSFLFGSFVLILDLVMILGGYAGFQLDFLKLITRLDTYF